MTVADHLAVLAGEAAAANERRLLVLQGDRSETVDALHGALGAAAIDTDGWVAIGDVEGPWSRIEHDRSDRLLGRTIPGLVIDATDSLRPNVIGRTIGAVAGGGIVVLLIGPPDEWVAGPLASDRRLVVPPYDSSDVTNRFRTRFLETLEQHRGISIIDAATGTVLSDGTTGPRPPPATCSVGIDGGLALPPDLRDACVTADQRRCVDVVYGLANDDVAVVEAHRGRGKSAAAGIAAAGFARDGRTVLVTGPGRDAVREVFDRAAAALHTTVIDDPRPIVGAPTGAGRVEFCRPHALEAHLGDADILIVDEAAAVAVDRLADTLDAGLPVAYLTTVHGYEGTGRGFAVRFQDTLERSGRSVDRLRLEEPIRYRLGDPIESWQFRALLLDASPPPAEAITDATPKTVAYDAVDRAAIAGDEADLRAVFGLLVLAHYRTEPDDLLRLLDAPNIAVRVLRHEGHPVSVALLAREGGLDEDWCDRLYAGESIRGHMLPDLLTTQLRDRRAGRPTGYRILRIATHDAVRSRGLGSQLLAAIEEEHGGDIDYLGAGFGATPRLVRFWVDAGYRPVHLGTSRNPRSGEHSAVLMREVSSAGADLARRHERRLIERLPGQLPDTLDDLDAALVVTMVASIDGETAVDIPPWMWDAVEAAARGPGQVATAPEAFARLALAGLMDGVGDELTESQRSLLVRRTLQCWPLWAAADESGLTLGDARAGLRGAVATLWSWYLDEHGDPRDAVNGG